ncbi:MAG TPA: YhjD/YihY/BrkB family envelope integrity protein [Nitrospira sp.]|nr:YhjD/YihY/BrkB family envelope integrity protein [Nitrospira sp.]
MSKVARIKEFVKQDLWTTDPNGVHTVQRLVIRSLRLAIAVAWEFRHRLLDARAAGLVYTTLLSLVPFLAVMFSVLKAFGVHHQIEPVLAQALAPLGPKGEEITATVIAFVDNLKVRVLGVVGVAGLFYTTYSLINKVEEALNAIWQVRQGRSWGRKFTDYLSVVLVGPLLVVTALGLLTSVQSQTLVQRILEIQPFGSLLVWVANWGPFLLLCGVFTFFYKFIPNTSVQTSSALVGGISAAVLWGIAGELFAKFVAQSANYSAIYSSFAVLIVFLVWLYVGWLIVLIGAQISFFHQHPAAYLSRLPWQQGAHEFRERLALRLLVALARHHVKGDPPPRQPELAGELRLPLSLIEEQVGWLVEQGFVGRLAEPEGVTLLRPPELITVNEILDATRAGGRGAMPLPSNPNDPVEDVLRRRDEAVAQSLAGLTLQSLVLGQGDTRTGELQAV